MTKERYFEICSQMGDEPNPDRIPPDVEDFPLDVQRALILFNKLGDRVLPDIGYLGKDYSQVPTLMEVYEVEDKKLFLEALLRLDARLIEKSQAEMKAARERLKKSG